MNNRLLTVVALLGVLISGCAGQAPAPDPSLIQVQPPEPVILDVDMAHDDMFAALFLLSHPNADLKAITVVGTGEAHCGPGVDNALGLVAVSGHEAIPVACGRDIPLAGDHVFPEAWRQGADDAYGVSLPAGGTPSDLGAADLIINTVQGSAEPVTIVAVGPLTNIAEALQKEPGISAGIQEIYIMGGAVDVEGNVGNSGAGIENEHAEWNIYIDPTAADIVFSSGIPIVLVPLDATRDVPVTRRFYGALEEHRGSAPAQVVFDMLTANLDFVDSGGFQFWDTLTAASFTDQSLATFEDVELTVVEEEGPESGRTRADPTGTRVKVAVGADRNRFEQTLLTVLNWEE